MKKIFLVFSIIFGFTTLYGQTGSNYFNLICEIQPYEVDGVSQNAFEVKLTPIFSGQDYVCGINFQLQLKLYDANQIPLETLELTEDNNNVVIFQSSTDYGYKGDVISNLKYRYLITPDCNIINNIEFLKIAAQMETPLDYINGGNGCGYLWNINMIVTYPNSNWADQSGVSPPQNGTTNQININSDYISIGENFGVNTTSLNADICLVDLNSFIFGSACHFPDVIQVFPFGGCPPYMVQLMINNTTLDLLSIEDLPSNFYEQFDDGSGTLQDNFLLLPDPVPNLYLAQEGAVTYTVIVTDSKNNTFQQDYEIDNMLVISQDLTIMLVNENDLNCFDRYYMSVTSYGSEVSLSGENEPLPNGNIIYYPDSYYNAAANSIWFYRNGAYTVGIFNENCDTYFMSDEVTITNAIPVLEAENTVFCEGESISIHDNTDFVYFSYQWYKDGTPISGANTDNISITESGDYYLEVVKEADCPAWQTNILSFTFYENNTSVSPPQQICMGESVQLLASGGVSYSWSPGIGLNSTNVANPIAAPTETTVYEVTIIDDNACTFTQSVEIIVYDLPATGISANQSICAGESTQLEATGGATYAWSPSEGLNNATISNPTASPAVTTTYTVNIANDNCAVAEQVTITVHPTPTASAGTDQSICQGESTQLTATGGISYAWSPATGLDNPNIANPTASPTSTTTYTVSVTDENGCTDSDEVMITVLDVPQLTISGPTKNDCNCNYVILSMESNMPINDNTIEWQVFDGSNWVHAYDANVDGGTGDDGYLTLLHINAPGTYRVQAQAADNSCIGTSQEIVIAQPDIDNIARTLAGGPYFTIPFQTHPNQRICVTGVASMRFNENITSTAAWNTAVANNSITGPWVLDNVELIFTSETAGITILRRSGIVANNCTFGGNPCQNRYWRGFVLRGVPNENVSQTNNPQFYHGALDLNNCTLTDAKKGVQIGDGGYVNGTWYAYAQSGGLLRANGTQFINCAVGIEVNERKTLPLAKSPILTVQNCQFITNRHFLGGTGLYILPQGYVGIAVEQGNGRIFVRDCSFDKNPSGFAPPSPNELPTRFGVGIQLWRSQITVTDACSFDELEEGIHILTDQSVQHNATISTNTFTNTFRGLIMEGCELCNITDNQFLQIPAGEQTAIAYGAAALECGQLSVSNNIFDSSDEGYTHRYGFWVRRSGRQSHNVVSCNDFTGRFDVATFFEGDNALLIPDYNSYTEANTRDWLIDENLSDGYQGIDNTLGSCDNPLPDRTYRNAFHPASFSGSHIEGALAYYAAENTNQMFVPQNFAGVDINCSSPSTLNCAVSNIEDEDPCHDAENWWDCMHALIDATNIDPVRQRLYREALSTQLRDTAYTEMKQILIDKDDIRSYKSLTATYVDEDDLVNAQAYLDMIPADTEENTAFKSFYQWLIDLGGWSAFEVTDTLGSGKQAAALAAIKTLSQEHSARYTDTQDNITAQANWASLQQSSYRRNPPPVAAKTVIESVVVLTKLEIVPNPAQDNITITLGSEMIDRWEIYNIQGRKILEGNETKIDLSLFTSGVYIVKAYTQGEQNYMEKLIITR